MAKRRKRSCGSLQHVWLWSIRSVNMFCLPKCMEYTSLIQAVLLAPAAASHLHLLVKYEGYTSLVYHPQTSHFCNTLHSTILSKFVTLTHPLINLISCNANLLLLKTGPKPWSWRFYKRTVSMLKTREMPYLAQTKGFSKPKPDKAMLFPTSSPCPTLRSDIMKLKVYDGIGG